MHTRYRLLLALLLAGVPVAQAQWTTVHGFAPRATSRFPFHAQGLRVVFSTPDSVFASSDGGATFTGRAYRSDLGLDLGGTEPVKGAGTWDGDLLLGSVCPQRCLTRSSDGKTWTRVPMPTTGSSAVYGLAMGVAGRGTTLTVITQPTTGVSDNSTIWRSTDGGASWRYATTPTVPGLPIQLFQVGGRYFLTTGQTNQYFGDLYTSADGETWTEAVAPVSGGLSPLQGVDVVVESGGALFASDRGFGLVRSNDGGATWARVASNLGGQRPFSLVGLGRGVLAGTVGNQHMKSTDFGVTWTASCPLYGRGFVSDDFEASGAFLFTRAGGEVGRIAYASCGLTAPVAAEAATSAPGLRLDAPAPNPARDFLTLRFTLAQPGAAYLALYDALGRQVAVLHAGATSGETTASLDASRLAPGVYLARLTTSGASATQRVVIAR